MKKIIALLLCAAMLLAFAACDSTKTNEESYNGITKTTTTRTSGGETTTEVTYTDEDGNTLEPELGEAAFEAAKNGDENPLETVQGAADDAAEAATEDTAADAEAADDTAAEEVAGDAAADSEAGAGEAEEAEAAAAEEEETLYTASLTFINSCASDITELYLSLAEDAASAENLLDEGYILEAGSSASLDGSVTYAPDTEFAISYVNSNGDTVDFGAFTFGSLTDPENITITFSEDDESYFFNVD